MKFLYLFFLTVLFTEIPCAYAQSGADAFYEPYESPEAGLSSSANSSSTATDASGNSPSTSDSTTSTAQTTSSSADRDAFYEPYEAPEAGLSQSHLPVKIYYNRGVWFKGGGNTLRIGGDLQVDGRAFFQYSNQPPNFRIRRARVVLEGTLQDTFGFFVAPLITTRDPTTLQQAFIETIRPLYARFRFGLFKEPFSLEATRSDLLIDFNERSIGIINFLQIEDIGAMLFGSLWKGKLEYGMGVFNGRGRQLENNSKKEYVGRLVYAPFLGSKGLLDQFYLGISGSTSHQRENLTGFTFVTGADTIFWIWTGDDEFPTIWDDVRNRWGADFEWFYGSFACRAEYLGVDWGTIEQGSERAHFSAEHGYIEVTYLLTGEKKIRNELVVPKHNFNLCTLKGGAWEIVGRYEVLTLDPASLNKGIAIGTTEVKGFTLGLNLYFNPYVVTRIDWEYFHFKEKVRWEDHWITGESVLIGRLQAVF